MPRRIALLFAFLALAATAHAEDAPPAKPEAVLSDPRVKAEVTRFLGGLNDATTQAKDFALEQAPLVLREMVTAGRIESVCDLFILIGLGLLLTIPVAKGFRAGNFIHTDSFIFQTLTFLGFFFFVGYLILFFLAIHDLIHAWFAPRLYILETLAGLVGTAAGK